MSLDPRARNLLTAIAAAGDPPTQFADGYSLTQDAMKWFWDQYLKFRRPGN